MHCQVFLGRGALLGAVATAALTALLPARAQTPVPAAVAPAALPSAGAVAPPAACALTLEQVRFDRALPRIGRRLASGKPIKIVALGSSSTYGAGASSSAASYPSRLAEDLARRFPGTEIAVLNRGVNGDEVAGMLARLDSAVIAEKPDLVLWQVGTNSLLRDKAVPPHASLLHERRWYETEHLPFDTFVSSDGLHMNDWSYACLAKALGMAIAEAATRPTATAIGTQAVR